MNFAAESVCIRLKIQLKKYNKSVFIYLVDLKKAFDKVRIKNIIRVLCDREIPFDIIKINENIYGNDITEARIDGQLTDPINIGTGIREREKLLKLLIQFNNG